MLLVLLVASCTNETAPTTTSTTPSPTTSTTTTSTVPPTTTSSSSTTTTTLLTVDDIADRLPLTVSTAVLQDAAIGPDGALWMTVKDDGRLLFERCADITCDSRRATEPPVSNTHLKAQIAIRSTGVPVVLWQELVLVDDEPVFTAVLAQCVDERCTRIQQLQRIDSGSRQAHLLLDPEDRPVVVHGASETEVAVTRCAGPACLDFETEVVWTADEQGGDLVAAGAGGDFVIGVFQSGDSGISLLRCDGAGCVAADAEIPIGDGYASNVGLSIVIADDGNPAVLFSRSSEMVLVRCGDPLCAANTTNTVPTPGQWAIATDLALENDVPVLVYYSGGSTPALEGYRGVRCFDPECVDWEVRDLSLEEEFGFRGEALLVTPAGIAILFTDDDRGIVLTRP